MKLKDSVGLHNNNIFSFYEREYYEKSLIDT